MLEGTQIGRFRLQEELGHGGMGTVYRAEDPIIGRHVAIKIIRLDDTGPPELQRQLAQSFLREIRTAGVLQHPGIVSIFDAGKQDNVAYIVMELVAGVTFESTLRAEPRPPLATLLGICRQAATALDYAHGHGVLHRDIKPSNILVQPNGAAKIVDFGIAKIAEAAQATTIMLSQTGTTVGTPDYMSPEQILGKPLDGRTDQWSLAVVAYIAMTGVKPFGGEHFTQVMGRIMTQDPDPPSGVNTALPRQVDGVMAKALAKEPAQRFGSCSEFLTALETACGAQPRPPSARTEQPAQPAATMTMALPPPPKRTSRWLGFAAGVLIAVALIAVVAGAVIIALRRYHPAQPAPAPVVQAPEVSVPKKPAVRPRTKVADAGRPAVKPAASENSKASPVVSSHAVRFVTTPPGAQVTADNQPASACQSPCTLELAAGQHTLRVTKDGYSPLFKNVVVDSDLAEVPMVLEQVTVPMRVVTVPAGATISVDGTVLASTTPTMIRLPMGTHSIKLTRDGFADYTTPVTVNDSLVQGISVTLAPAH